MTDLDRLDSPRTAFDEAWEARQTKLAALRCANGHRMAKRFAFHVGSWKACLGCGLIEQIPTLRIVR